MITKLHKRFRLQSSLFQSKVARRIFVLFVFAALAPIVAITLLFYVQNGLRNSHIEKDQLHATTKAMGMALLTELEDVQVRLRYLRSLPPGRRAAAFRKISGDEVVRYAIFDAGRRIDGEAGEYPRIPAEVRLRAARGEPTLLEGSEKNGMVRLFMAVPSSASMHGLMLAELNMKTLGLGLKDDDDSELCILTDRYVPTYCDPRMPRHVLDSVKRGSSSTDIRSLSWTKESHTWRGGYWTLYTQPSYHLRSLMLIWAVPASYLLPGHSGLDKVLLPAAIFTLLMVTLLSINLIRRVLAPLDLLKTATRVLSKGDFTCRVKTGSGDEFDDLAGSFNTMAADIHRQFRELDTMGELDRRVLSAQGAEEIMSVLLARLPEIVGCSAVGIAVLDGDRVQTEGWSVHGKVLAQEEAGGIVQLDGTFLSELRSCENFLRIESPEQAPLLRPLFDAGIQKVACVPVKQQDTVSAIVCLGCDGSTCVPVDGIAQVHRIADHAALAFSNAAWEEKLYHQAHYDSLTGLPNRQLFTSRLDDAIAAAQRNSGFVALLFIDVDRFKSLNDTVGHHAGDEYLNAAARAMQSCVGPDSTLARLGGDEFTVIVPNLASVQRALEASEDAAEKVRRSFLKPITIEGQDIALSASIGIAIYPTDADNRIALLRCADQAMYNAKDQGRNGWAYYSREINASAVERLELGAALAGALERRELAIHLQPQVEAATGRLCGAEVLLRWEHPKWGQVSPAKFIPIAEQTGLIVNIGAWVLQQACLQLRAWRDTAKAGLSLAINVSALQLRRSDYVDSVMETIRRYDVDPALIELEVTESMCADDVEGASALFRTLKSHGLSISIDDFGTGYSSMKYLRHFPIDIIKIDRAFLQGVPGDSFNTAITQAILTMAENLRCEVVAEGVETLAQLEFLRKRNGGKAQGFYIAKPMPIAAFEQWAEQRLSEQPPAQEVPHLRAVPAGD